MADPIRVGDLLTGDPDSEQRARARFDQRLETLAGLDETLTHRVIDFAAWAAMELARYPALAVWVGCGYATSLLRGARSSRNLDPDSHAQDI